MDAAHLSWTGYVIASASEAIQTRRRLDCFVALLLAMTGEDLRMTRGVKLTAVFALLATFTHATPHAHAAQAAAGPAGSRHGSSSSQAKPEPKASALPASRH